MTRVDVITMPERFGIMSSASFRSEFELALTSAAGGNRVVSLDGSQVSFIDSTGLGLLILSYKKARELNVKISVINLKKSIKDILSVANMQKIIDIH